MNKHIPNLILTLTLLCIAFTYSHADAQTPKNSDDMPYIAGKIDSIDHDKNLLKFYGVTYHYSGSTLITLEGHDRTTESRLTPGTRVRLIMKPIAIKSREQAYELSEIIIREAP